MPTTSLCLLQNSQRTTSLMIQIYKLKMQHNVPVGRQSLTKKISFHDKHPKPYRTIDSLEKAPTRKKFTVQQYPLKKQSHSILTTQPSKHPDRKIKSLTKHELRKPTESNKKKSVMSSQPQLATLEGLINRNIKFSISKERQRLIQKQKYKRSEQIRSVLDQKKNDSFSRIDRKDTEPNPRLSHIYSSISVQKSKPVSEKLKIAFTDLNLQSLINTEQGEQHQVTLQDVFEAGCFVFYEYLLCKQERLSCTNNVKTYDLKVIKEELSILLERAMKKFKIILKEAGQMSIKNILMVALVKFEQNKWNQTIMYINKALDKTDNNLMLLQLPGPDLKIDKTITELSTVHKPESNRCYKLNFLAYLNLAQSYKQTHNYLCAINTLVKWQENFLKIVNSQSMSLRIKTQYKTQPPKESEEDKIEIRHQMRMKKKSYVLNNNLQSDSTTNKFKKFSHAYHHTSIQFNKSQKNIAGSDRSKNEQSEDEIQKCTKTIDYKKDSMPIYESLSHHESSQYEKEITAIYLLLARLYVKIKSYDLAITHYKKCLEYDHKKIEAILELASLLYTQYHSAKCIDWLNTAIGLFQNDESEDEKSILDINYIKYHKALILIQEGSLDGSYQLLEELTAKELWSQVNYYKGYIRTQKLRKSNMKIKEKNIEIESILMHFKQAITSFTSRQYLIKSYFQILLMLVFQKKDYYGAQYEVNRFRKLIPFKQEHQPYKQEEARVSRISRILEDEDPLENESAANRSLGLNEEYFSILFDIIDAVICILKMKILKGLTMLKELSLRVESQEQEIIKYYGGYYSQIVKLILQFKFYSYYIQREYQLSLKHINKLIDIYSKEQHKYKESDLDSKIFFETDLKLLHINKLMLECMILMKQGKHNYAMSKLAEIQNSITQQNNQNVSNSLISNNFYMVKSICFINLYTQLEAEKNQSLQAERSTETNDQNNKEILLSAEELLRHCLISDKENSLIYYLISSIHYEIEQYESSLKYIREALEFSDDHMIKHYFCKANTKIMLGRYDEAVKDYTNAVIVYKEQLKNEVVTEKKENSSKKINKIQIEEHNDEYYQEQQIMYHEIYLNRAIAYLKQAYQLSKSKNYPDYVNIILSYKMKTTEDLIKYFEGLLNSNINLHSEKIITDRLLLFLHSDDPSQIFEISKKFQPRLKLLREEDSIKAYYLVKELNNCITHLKSYIYSLQHKKQEVEPFKLKKESMPPKYKKVSITMAKKSSQPVEPLKILKLKFDLTCLQALKKSSTKTQEALQEALISLLQLTEQIYKSRQQQLQNSSKLQEANYTLEELFINNCGNIFKWSDILFFIGVIHFELKQYETAIKYFQQSYNQKRMNNSLYTLEKYLYPILTKSNSSEQEEDEEEQLFSELQPLFQNRIYCKQQLQYNLGICYLMLKKYKQAYFYLQNYPSFLQLIKKSIAIGSVLSNDNEFITESVEKPKKGKNQILIADCSSADEEKSNREFKLHQESREKLKKREKDKIQKSTPQYNKEEEEQEAQEEEKESTHDQFQNITPFPTRNRLCSIYSPKIIDDKKLFLSFCLPKVDLPSLGLFYEQQMESAKIYSKNDDKQNSFETETQALRESMEEKPNLYKINKNSIESVINHISLLDLQMKPIAPWIKQNACGVIFTENVVNQSVELNSSRTDLKKDKKDNKDGMKKGKNERYAESNIKQE